MTSTICWSNVPSLKSLSWVSMWSRKVVWRRERESREAPLVINVLCTLSEAHLVASLVVLVTSSRAISSSTQSIRSEAVEAPEAIEDRPLSTEAARLLSSCPLLSSKLSVEDILTEPGLLAVVLGSEIWAWLWVRKKEREGEGEIDIYKESDIITLIMKFVWYLTWSCVDVTAQVWRFPARGQWWLHTSSLNNINSNYKLKQTHTYKHLS